MKQLVRIIRLLFGLFLYGLGSYLGIQANVGLAPWEAFQMGISQLTGIQYGNVVVLLGLVILLVDAALGEPIGLGSCLNMLLIGKFVDLFNWIGLVPQVENFWGGVLVMLAGQTVLCVGSYFYMGSGYGCGPRDYLMVALGKRFRKIPVGMIRGAIEGTVLLVGWLMGSKVGIGTVIAVFGIGFILQAVFRLFRFDVKAVRHESLLETFHIQKTRMR